MTQEVQRWLDMAATDLGVAKHLALNYHPKPLEIICYHCQQAAEKSIKALIIYCKLPGSIPKVHDLSFLLNQLTEQIEIDDEYYDYADTLTPYGVSVRYPNELFLSERHAEQAINYAETITKWATNIIQQTIKKEDEQ